MKIIAVPSDGNTISPHFGHCSEFNLFEVDNNQIKSKKTVANPGHQPGFLPKFLNEQGVDIVLAGGMGRRAVDLFKQNGIEVITGARGNVEQGVKNYLEDNLETEEEICDH